MAEQPPCPRCGCELPARAPQGLCPRCLFREGLDDESPSLATGATPAATITLAAGADGASVLATLAATVGPLPRVLLRDTEGDSGVEPLVQPASPEMPSLADRSAHLQLFGEIARGGMGAVLKGRDEDLGRDLAVKVLLEKHRDQPELVRRFIEEAQIAGQLQHPGVVPIYELGAFADHRPFFTMKLVKGRTLAAVLAERGSPAEGLMGLLATLLQVSQTMAFAHARGVIHRDLKPSNVMVGSFGEVQVMDWGLAKVLPTGGAADDATAGRDGGGATVIATARSGSDSDLSHAGSVLGTPAYMAPEQARGEVEAVDERADVFALGSILGEILTGAPAFTGRDSAEIQRRAARGETADALARLDACAADAELVGLARDCLAAEPEDRPRDAGAVAERVTTYLAGVQDRLHASERDRAVAEARAVEERRKRRWQLGLAASVAAFLLLGGAGLASFAAILNRQKEELARANAALDRQRARAEDREQMAIDAVKRFRDAVAENPELESNPDLESLRKALLKEPLAFFRALRDRLQADGDTRPESLALLAAASFELGNLTDAIGDKQDALASHREALEIRRKLAEAHPDVAEYQHDLAGSHHNLGALLAETGHLAEARASHEAALAIWRRLAEAHPTAAEYRSDLAGSHHNLGSLLYETGQLSEARAAYEAALAIWRRLADAYPDVAEYRSDLAESQVNLGSSLLITGQLSEARAAYESARAILRRLADDHPDARPYRRVLATCELNLGNLLHATGHPDEARAAYEAARAILQRLADENPAVDKYQGLLADSHNSLGNLLYETGQLSEARAAYEAALAIYQRLGEAHPTVTKYRSGLAGSHNNLGNLLGGVGRPDEARAAYEAALAIYQRLGGDTPEVTDSQRVSAVIYMHLGLSLYETGHWSEARASLESGREILQRLAEAHPDVAEYQHDLGTIHCNLGNLLYEVGQPDEARSALESARAIFRQLADANPTVILYQRGLANSHHLLGRLLFENGDPAGARAAYEAALAIRRRLADELAGSPDDAGNLGCTLNNLALIEHDAGELAAARDLLRQAIARQREALAANPSNPTYRRFLRGTYANLLETAAALDDADLAAEAERGLAEVDAGDPVVAELDARLAAVLGGEEPWDDAERIGLAHRAYATRRFAAAARLLAEALEASPALADDREAQHRYNAACCAALAAAGQGEDAPPPDDAARAALRRRALDWLEDELAAWSAVLDADESQARSTVRQTLLHWKADPDLAGVRNPDALAALPEDEREAWQAFWTEVDRILKE